MGRQPIFDRDLEVRGYELLFRDGATGSARFVDGDHATSTVMLNSVVEIGLDRLVGDVPAFVNFTKRFLLASDLVELTPHDRVVLEILEDIEPEPRVIEVLRELKGQGFRLALDDFVYREELLPMIEIADIIKLDLQAMEREEVVRHVQLLTRYPATLLAEKVENREELEWCRDLGFDLFQGYFLCRPEIVRGRRLPSSRLSLLQLLARLNDGGVGVDEVEDLVSQDVSLSYRLVRLVNSPHFALPNEVKSIPQAIMMLGLRRLRNLATMISMSGISDKPHELMVTAMLRARMCELLSDHIELDLGSESMFAAGLFSVLDALLDCPMPEVLGHISLATPIRNALLGEDAAEAHVLESVKAYERGAWDEVETLGIDRSSFTEAWLGAVDWTREAVAALRG